MPVLLWVAIVVFAIIFVWWQGRQRGDGADLTQSPPRLSKEYFVGLNYLLNEEPDKAVDVFIKLLEVDSDTVETHLALGNLFRRRGEVDRAIRVHQNLIARPQLSKPERVRALLALGEDYMAAGVLDRAERLFSEVAATGEHSTVSLRYLIAIYQQEKDWTQCIETALKLQALGSDEMAVPIAHFYCELALEAKHNGAFEAADNYLHRALSAHGQSVRASLLQGDLEKDSGKYKQALRSYKRVRDQDPAFLADAMQSMITCYERLDAKDSCLSYFLECVRAYPSTEVILLLAEQLQKWRGEKDAAQFIVEQLRLTPSLKGLDRLIDYHLSGADAEAREDLLLLKNLTTRLVSQHAVYRCDNCGYGGKVLSWQCPSCKKWSTVKPLVDISVTA